MRARFIYGFLLLPAMLTAQSGTTAPVPTGVIPRSTDTPPRPQPGVLKGKTYALLIGISTYQHDPPVQSLKFADKDALTFKDLLTSDVGGGLQPDQIRLLINEGATRATIDDAVKNFVSPHASPDNTLIFFVAGHGVYLKTEENPVTHKTLERDPYILTYESNSQDPKTTGYPMAEFRGMIAQQAVTYGRVLVFVDVCHADNVAGIAGGSELQVPVQKVFDGAAGDLGLLMASGAKQSAIESSNFGGGHGAFSYFLVDGMNGAAALEGESSLTFVDVAEFVHNNVSLFTRRAQVPSAIATHDDMILVPDVHKKGIPLAAAEPLSESEIRDIKRQRGQKSGPTTQGETTVSAASDLFDDALRRGRLLPE